MGVTESLYFPAALGIIAVFHPGPTRSRALGIHQTAQFAGIILGGWYGGWAAEHIGWRVGFGHVRRGYLLLACFVKGIDRRGNYEQVCATDLVERSWATHPEPAFSAPGVCHAFGPTQCAGSSMRGCRTFSMNVSVCRWLQADSMRHSISK